jgi:hypothetical protein
MVISYLIGEHWHVTNTRHLALADSARLDLLPRIKFADLISWRPNVSWNAKCKRLWTDVFALITARFLTLSDPELEGKLIA